jgi:hypothetical protein
VLLSLIFLSKIGAMPNKDNSAIDAARLSYIRGKFWDLRNDGSFWQDEPSINQAKKLAQAN